MPLTSHSSGFSLFCHFVRSATAGRLKWLLAAVEGDSERTREMEASVWRMPLSVWLLSPRLTGVIRNRASGETSYWNSDGGNKALVGWKGKGHVQGSRAQAETTARAEMKAIQLSLSALRDQTRCQTLCDFTKGGEQTSFFPKCSTHTHEACHKQP